MNWIVKFYDEKVKLTLHEWPRGIQAKFIWIVELIQEFGPYEIGMPHIKTLGQGLFEIRAKGNEGIGRAFFCIKNGKVLVIVSGFIKKSQQTPPKELALARKRVTEVKKHG